MALLDSIRREHALIVRGLAAVELYAGRVERELEVDRGDLRAFAAFFTDFAELWHNAKEEDIVLPALVRNGYAWNAGPVARLREEHEQESYLVRVVDQAARQEGSTSKEDGRHLVAAIRSLVDFERRHIQTEEASVYRAVAEEMPAEVQDGIDQELVQFQAHRFPNGTYDEAFARADGLFRRYESASV